MENIPIFLQGFLKNVTFTFLGGARFLNHQQQNVCFRPKGVNQRSKAFFPSPHRIATKNGRVQGRGKVM